MYIYIFMCIVTMRFVLGCLKLVGRAAASNNRSFCQLYWLKKMVVTTCRMQMDAGLRHVRRSSMSLCLNIAS